MGTPSRIQSRADVMSTRVHASRHPARDTGCRLLSGVSVVPGSGLRGGRGRALVAGASCAGHPWHPRQPAPAEGTDLSAADGTLKAVRFTLLAVHRRGFRGRPTGEPT